ncbi:phage antirepressor N-terminal domain-containing protein [Pectobacterium betavasculorum]|uniref:phage antirepressor N-terminal domain-containing protein n=1 Tax=Pectobacterium betavasculorum TaxID=55207 RepID=UPI00313E3A7F
MTSIATAPCAINVPFYGTDLYVVNHCGEPYTPMKPIVEGMGMDWMGQYTKLKQRFSKGIEEISIPTAGGIQKMICLALRKLAAWLNTISPNKVKAEIRDHVIRYQNECDDVLYEYWTKGQVTNPRKTNTDERTPLRDAVNLLVGKKGIMYPEAYSYIHQRFNVASIDELAPELLPQAVEYVHKLALDGELLPRQLEQGKAPASWSLPTESNRVLLYLHPNGAVAQALPLREDQILLTLNDFAELARRNGWVVMRKEEMLEKITGAIKNLQ